MRDKKRTLNNTKNNKHVKYRKMEGSSAKYIQNRECQRRSSVLSVKDTFFYIHDSTSVKI